MFKCDIRENTFTRERDMRRDKKNVHEKGTGVQRQKRKKSLRKKRKRKRLRKRKKDSLKRHEELCCKCSRCAKQLETLNCLNNHRCFTNVSKEAPPTQKLKSNSVAASHGKFILNNQFVCNLKIVVSRR